MLKKKNKLGHYMLTADRGMTLTDGEIYTKIYISGEDIDLSAWTEVEDSAVPENEELTDSEALAILVGGATDA